MGVYVSHRKHSWLKKTAGQQACRRLTLTLNCSRLSDLSNSASLNPLNVRLGHQAGRQELLNNVRCEGSSHGPLALQSPSFRAGVGKLTGLPPRRQGYIPPRPSSSPAPCRPQGEHSTLPARLTSSYFQGPVLFPQFQNSFYKLLAALLLQRVS